jgi:RNA recognition motif-containing protein
MTKIFVGNLAFTTSERELRSTFEHYGRVASVRMICDQNTGNPRGFAFVGMPSWEDAEEAIVRLNGRSVSGRNIVVSQAQAASTSSLSARAANSFLDQL